jgi:hypothetical protein
MLLGQKSRVAENSPISMLTIAAAKLEFAMQEYCETAAGLNVDVTAIAWSLSDVWGQMRFAIAQRAAQVRNAAEGRRQNGIR